jgi:prophage regulatory protein
LPIVRLVSGHAEAVVKSHRREAYEVSFDMAKSSQPTSPSATSDDAAVGQREWATETAAKGVEGRRLLRGIAVRAKTGLGRSTLYAMVRAGTFPRPVALGPRVVAWVADEVAAWVTARISARDHAAAMRPDDDLPFK